MALCKPCSNGYYQLSLSLPAISKQAQPGQYIIINQLFSFYILGNEPNIEIIIPKTFKEQVEQHILSHPIELKGQPLAAPDPTQFNLLIAENDGLSACLFYLRKYRKHFKGLVLIGSNRSFPFKPCPSRHLIPGMPSNVIGALPLLEDWGIPHRLASTVEMPGIYHGCIKDLASQWLENSKHAAFNNINITDLDA